jgi:biotin operon repressor/dihydroneopterin aldolase
MDTKKFLEFAESLKLVRKTRIEDFIQDKNVDDIYTDLLPDNGIINKLNLPRTTILVGRKGTGKSTIFQKSQKDLIENKKCISIYIDINSLYDNSSPSLSDDLRNEISEELNKYLIYSNLIKQIVLEVKARLDDFVKQSIFSRVLGYDYERIEKLNIELEKIENSITNVIKKVDLSLVTSFKNSTEDNKKSELKGNLKISKDPSLELGGNVSKNGTLKKEFESTLITYLDIKSSLIQHLSRIKEILEIEHLYIFLDDFSEINEGAQKIFMDWFIAPLNNLSDDFVKFKIAAYPGRFYYGKLDNSKFDEISLDFFDAFYTFNKVVDINRMEALALDYTKRLITKRLNLFFPNNHWEQYFDMSEQDLFDILFSVSYNNPRKIGSILSFCYESSLIHGSPISLTAIENAAQRYYSDIVLRYFLANQFAIKPFDDKISNEHQYDLLKKIVSRQKTNASSAYRTRIKGKPTNHFTISNNLTHLLENLELNGFITTYNITKDKNDEESTVFSLDYGLCKRNNLSFCRASNTKLITYYSQPRFNMNVLVVDHFNKTQVIKCPHGHEYPFSMHETLKSIKMRCPDCLDDDRITKCEVVISSEEIRDKMRAIEKSNMNKTTFEEFLTLDYLKSTGKSASLSRLSSAIDKSALSIKKLINKLQERGMVKFDIEISQKLKSDYYAITDKGSIFVIQINKEIKAMSEGKA